MGDFELAGDLEGLSFSGSVLLLKLLLLLPFEMLRSAPGSTRFFILCFLTISGSGYVAIIIIMIIVVDVVVVVGAAA